MRQWLSLHRLSLVAVSSTWHYIGELKAQGTSDKVTQVESEREFLMICLKII